MNPKRKNRQLEHHAERQATRAVIRGDHPRQPRSSRWSHRSDPIPVIDPRQQAIDEFMNEVDCLFEGQVWNDHTLQAIHELARERGFKVTEVEYLVEYGKPATLKLSVWPLAFEKIEFPLDISKRT